MSRQIATVVYITAIIGLLLLDRDRKVRTSKALWLPILWVFLAWARPVSQWLQVGPAQSFDDLSGNPLERAIFSAVEAMALVVLVLRGRRVITILRMNTPILLYIGYCAASTLWSDFPGVAFKRWIKVVGDLVMVLIILTDREQSAAVRQFFTRVTYLFVPLSVLIIKYYPELGMGCSPTTGKCMIVGLTTDKNMLGVVCLVFAIGTVWRLLHTSFKAAPRTMIGHLTMLSMLLWLFVKAYSVTSIACFMIATTLLVYTAVPSLARKRALLHVTVLALLSFMYSLLFLHLADGVLHAVGKDATLSDRTLLWSTLSGMVPNFILGAGFESYWLGPRLLKIWSFFGFQPNEAHNGFFEVFLNLGAVGLGLIGLLIATGYRRAIGMLRWEPEGAGLRLAFVVIAIAYSFTEASFRMLSPIWICFLLSVFAIERRSVSRRDEPAPVPAWNAQPPALEDEWATGCEPPLRVG